MERWSAWKRVRRNHRGNRSVLKGSKGKEGTKTGTQATSEPKRTEAERDPHPIFVKQDTKGKSFLGHIYEKNITQLDDLEK